MSKLIESCPVCIENPAEYYTECGHCYCVGCLSRIKKCSMCRKSLMRTQLCIEIKSNKRNKIRENLEQTDNEKFIGSYFSNYYVLRMIAGMGGGMAYST